MHPPALPGPNSPLVTTLARYADFFVLFGDFRGYVKFFLLGDVVNDGTAKFFMPFDDVPAPTVPEVADSYRAYRRRSIEFIQGRSHRIDKLNTLSRRASTLLDRVPLTTVSGHGEADR